GPAPSPGRVQPSNPPTTEIPPQTVLASPPTPSAAPSRTAEDVLRDLLRRCAGAGFATAFLLGVDPGAGALRGELVSDGEAARELDYALGITSGKFAVPLDDRYNAIAR